jgi:phenylalanine ammonia-lyase
VGVHALYLQALLATNQSFHPFIHAHKPHAGQIWSAEQMLRLLDGSRLITDELQGHRRQHQGDLIQDRYSIRCLPQYMGPLVDGVAQVARQVETEANSVTDNPLLDAERDAFYHCGNFLGQYIGVAMDHLRYFIGLLAKHLDAQIAMLVAPEFNRGLAPSLVGNPERKINVGLKALQLTGNSIMPLLTFYGNSLADRFPTHAEQFNQNINSQGFGSANLARRSVETFEQYMALALMFAVQAVDLRSHAVQGHFDARRLLSPATVDLYEAVRRVAGRDVSADRPFVRDDHEQFLDVYIARIAADIAAEGDIITSLAEVVAGVEEHGAA